MMTELQDRKIQYLKEKELELTKRIQTETTLSDYIMNTLKREKEQIEKELSMQVLKKNLEDALNHPGS